MVICFSVLLCAGVLFAGCTSQPATPSATTVAPTTVQTAAPTTVQTVALTTSAPAQQATATVTKTPTLITKVILSQKGNVTPATYKTYDFKSMGDEFSQIGVVYKIAITADKPILGYAVTNDQVATLQGNEMTPQYVSSSDKVQWGLLNPYMVMEKVTNTDKSFTVDKIAPYVYVLDGRWMATDMKYNTTPVVNYEITITKIYNPVPTPNQGTS